MKKVLIVLLLILSVFVLANTPGVYSKSIDEMSLEEIERELANITAAIGPLKQESGDLYNKIVDVQNRIGGVEQRVRQLAWEIEERTEELIYQKAMFDQRVRSQYIKQRTSSSPLLTIFAGEGEAADLAREVSFSKVAARKDRTELIAIAENLVQLKRDKDSLEKVRQDLAIAKASFAQRREFLEGEIESAEQYKAQLSAKQKELLAARSGSFTSAVGEVPVSNIACSGPPGSPSYCNPGGGTWFAAFSFGAWTHRKGMSQYGAKGRVEAGQNYVEVLRAYYGKEPVGKDTNGDIQVQGYGSLNFEEYYLMGIAEMPSSWPKEALKAQAIAARTYAYRYKQNGSAICTTQACQVFSKSKADNPPSAWREAVQETRGKVIEDVITYYSSTAGGYLTTSGWDTTDGQGGEGFATRAWESKAGSPWFYSSWYTKGFNTDTGTCGRSHPWLTEAEMADILNAWLVLKKHRDDARILPVTINQCPINGVTGDPYSLEEMKNKANENGGAYTGVSSVSVRYGNDGQTSTVIFQTNKGEVSISGSEFLEAFNLRAPGFVAIRSPLFNIEKK
ncbi:MAG: SpoIID/LytB domain-containing protein [Candidatus Shapirobacteria bacterium]|nr:SpoIID/LytB domain-containing protein [Candidatus Shapirobacteria bacterium]